MKPNPCKYCGYKHINIYPQMTENGTEFYGAECNKCGTGIVADTCYEVIYEWNKLNPNPKPKLKIKTIFNSL